MQKFWIIIGLFTLLNNDLLAQEAASVVSREKAKYSYYYNNNNLQNALQMFAKSNSLGIRFAKQVNTKQLINGRFTSSNKEEFLDILATQFGFNWFIYSGVLYITSNKILTKTVSVSAGEINNIRVALADMGLLNSKFGFSGINSENKIVLSGPLEYINLIINQIQALNIPPSSEQFAVYRLKYAKANDIKLSFNNQDIIIPGVATLLKRLLDVGKSSLSSKLNSQVSINENNHESSLAGNLSTPIIEADSRLNTIVIRDKPSNLKIYQNLINSLDIEAPLIQVEVTIIKLDQTNLDEAGIGWNTSYKNMDATLGANSSKLGSLAFNYSQLNPGQLLVSDMKNFMLSLNFFNSSGYSKITSKPSIATIDNLPAIINNSANLYLTINQVNPNAQNQSSNNGSTQAQINSGLQITPHLIAKGDKRQISLDIAIIDGFIEDDVKSIYPSSTQNTVNSQAVIEEGQSLLLAGYTKEEKVEMKREVPVLGSIPLLGWFFKTSHQESHKITTLYLVEPKVITSNSFNLKDFESRISNK